MTESTLELNSEAIMTEARKLSLPLVSDCLTQRFPDCPALRVLELFFIPPFPRPASRLLFGRKLGFFCFYVCFIVVFSSLEASWLLMSPSTQASQAWITALVFWLLPLAVLHPLGQVLNAATPWCSGGIWLIPPTLYFYYFTICFSPTLQPNNSFTRNISCLPVYTSLLLSFSFFRLKDWWLCNFSICISSFHILISFSSVHLFAN